MKRFPSPWLCLLLLAAGCVYTTTYHDMRDLEIEPGVTTKEDLIEQLGVPRGVRRQGEDTVLVFQYSEVNGSGYGIGNYAIMLAVESTHSGVDFLEVVVGPDRVVRSFRLAAVPRETPTWPSEGQIP